jgi:hypothetical protein
MTQERIQQCIDAIERAGVKCSKSKKAARQFLIDAGIIEKKKRARSTRKKK